MLVMAAVISVPVAGRQDPAAQLPGFRGSTEIVAIDAHVVGRDGTPIPSLKLDDFEIFIDGRRRPVVSAEFVKVAGGGPDTRAVSPAPSGIHAAAAGRVVMLGIDEASFPMAAHTAAREAATRVLAQVSPDDYLGMMTFPGMVTIAPSRDRAPVREAIPRIAGARVDSLTSRFNLSASEAAQLRARAPVATQEILGRLCRAFPPDPTCSQQVMEDASQIVAALETQGMATVMGLHTMLDALASVPGRKTFIVVSAGLPMSNLPGWRPSFDAESARLASRAAAANVNLYIFYMNVHFLHFFSPAYGKINHSIYDDISMFGYGLEKFADAGGGSFFQIEVDSDPFVGRALRETSASYLLAVRVEPGDRDGKEHFIRVSVKTRGATVRYRRVLVVPGAAK